MEDGPALRTTLPVGADWGTIVQISVAYLLMRMPVPSEVFLSVEVKALIRAGFDIRVFCLRPKLQDNEKLREVQGLSSVPIHNFAYVLSRRVWSDVWYWLRRKPAIVLRSVFLIVRTCWTRPRILLGSLLVVPKSFSIAREIERQLISVVHAAWGHYPSVTASLIKQLMPHVELTLALGAYDRVARHPMTVVAARHAAFLLTQSNASAELLKLDWPKSPTRVVVVRRGIDITSICASREIDIDGDRRERRRIVSIGRLIKEKGHQHVIEAFVHVIHAIPQARLSILGEGNYRGELQRLITNRGLRGFVELTGHLSQPELFRYLGKSSVCCMASESIADNIPNTVKEAMALGVPVVATPVLGIDELVEDDVTGCLVPMGNIPALANSIIRILSDEEFARGLAARARALVENHFDVEETTRSRAELFTELHKRSCSSPWRHLDVAYDTASARSGGPQARQSTS
jgi:glycosyltransferase involved in cell wall biosynthesis